MREGRLQDSAIVPKKEILRGQKPKQKVTSNDNDNDGFNSNSNNSHGRTGRGGRGRANDSEADLRWVHSERAQAPQLAREQAQQQHRH